jgi:mycofactocin precursor
VAGTVGRKGSQQAFHKEEIIMKKRQENEPKAMNEREAKRETTDILEEIEVEDLTVDGICGVY